MNDKWQHTTQQEIQRLLKQIASAESQRNQTLPTLSDAACKQLALHIKQLLRKNLH